MDLNKGIHVVFDGGSKGNGDKNEGYGSFKTFYNGKEMEMTIDNKKTNQCFLEWEGATNNEAEWKTCVAALAYCIELRSRMYNDIQDINKVIKNYPIILHSDSENVVFGLMPKDDDYVYKIKAGNLLPLAERARSYMTIIPATIVKEPREYIVKILGH